MVITHNHTFILTFSSKILNFILQESFESKQASMFLALDKLFALQNAMLLESRIIKAFFIYSISIFVIYMLTSTKQTYNVRPWLHIGMYTKLSFSVLSLETSKYYWLNVTDYLQDFAVLSLLKYPFSVLLVITLSSKPGL